MRARVRISPRREVRFALLAAMETCWVYAVLAFLAIITGGRALLPLTLFAAYWIALLTGRTVPLIPARWARLQAVTLAIALVTLLVVLRLEVYTTYAPLDFSWLAQYGRDLLALSQGFSSAPLATLAIAYVFIRGLGFGQRPLTLWFIGFQFRLGIVVFFLLLLVAGFVKHFEPALLIFAYFFLSLLAIALARMDEMQNRQPLGPGWVVTLLAGVALVIFLGLALLQVLTLQAANEIVAFLAPLGVLAGMLLFLIAIPFGYLAAWLVDLLRPLFANLADISKVFQNLLPQQVNDALRNAQENSALVDLLLPLLKTALVVAAVIALGYWLARTLNRRMKQSEEEEYVREAIGDDEEAARAIARRKKQAARRPRSGDMAAESIRRIYAALVARAAQAGLARRVAETPYEFLPRLEQSFPEQASEVRTITEAYIAVHYAEHTAAPEEVHRVRELWNRIWKRMKRRV